MNPFLTFRIWPDYGNGSARIEWAAVAPGQVHLYRSESGVAGSWIRLNTDALDEAGVWQDQTVPREDIHALHYYRGMLVTPDEEWVRGPSLRADHDLTNREYGILRQIIRREWINMRRGNGLPAFHCIPKSFGTPAAGYDPETKILSKKGCPGDPDYGYGTAWAGGFYKPVATRVRLTQIDGLSEAHREDMTGEDQEKPVRLRLLAFPVPRKGHMIVLPESGRRYALRDPMYPFWFKAAHPVAWEAVAVPLDRRDPRYKFPVPETLQD